MEGDKLGVARGRAALGPRLTGPTDRSRLAHRTFAGVMAAAALMISARATVAALEPRCSGLAGMSGKTHRTFAGVTAATASMISARALGAGLSPCHAMHISAATRKDL